MLLNIICALFGALSGAWIGHEFTMRLFKQKAKKQLLALNNEISIINDR
ncbi:hypothetical protein ACPUVO_09135 [Pseudocolwellia sp. HL-MZ19]